jgi:hypothetical protein
MLSADIFLIFLAALIAIWAFALIIQWRQKKKTRNQELAINYEPEEFTKRITAAVDNLRSTLESELSRLEDSLKNQSGDVHEKVAERKRLAKELGLDKKLCEIYDEIRFYPSWSKSEDWWPNHRLCEIDNPTGEKRNNDEFIRFEINNKKYELVYQDEEPNTRHELGDFHHTYLKLLDGEGRCLIGINVSVDVDYIVEFKPFGIAAFLPGDWMQDILFCYEKFQTNKKRKDIEEKYVQSEVHELKDKFGLD